MSLLYQPFPIVLALGCNLGPRRETLEWACRLLERAGVRIVRRSNLYWTRPWGVRDQPDFMNAAVAVRTRLSPRRLLDLCMHLEARLGRRRRIHWGPRRIDIDLLLYGDLVLRAPGLSLPHPGIARRDFVLAPLIDLQAPPPRSLAPRGWRVLLDELPDAQRTPIHHEPWR